MYYLTAFVIYTQFCMLYTTHMTSCCIPHPFVIARTYVCCIGVSVLCHSSMSHLSLPLCTCTWPSFFPLVLFTPFTSSPFICACTLSLSSTRFRSQLYISHNTCTQVENKTTFIASLCYSERWLVQGRVLLPTFLCMRACVSVCMCFSRPPD